MESTATTVAAVISSVDTEKIWYNKTSLFPTENVLSGRIVGSNGEYASVAFTTGDRKKNDRVLFIGGTAS